MIFLLSTIFILLHSLTKVHSSCHSCQSNFAVCHDERHYTMCTEGIAADEMYTCPDGYVCTAEIEICVQSSISNPVQPTCEAACGLCNSPEKLFACLDATTYAYCFGVDVPDYSASGICPDGYVCNLSSREVCTLASQVYPSCYEGASNAPTTLLPSSTSRTTGGSTSNPSDFTTLNPSGSTSTVTESQTSSSTVTADSTTSQEIITTNKVTDSSIDPSTSTESPAPAPTTTTAATQSTTTLNPRDEAAFCSDKQQGGLYKSDNDPTCQEFILCYILSGQYLGIRYTCIGSQFFNEDTKMCQVERPGNC